MKSEEIKKEYKKFKIGILSAFAIVILLLLILLDYIFVVRKSYKALAPETQVSSGIDVKNETDTNGSKDQIDSTSTNDPAATFYNQGLKKFAAKDYQGALVDFANAIKENPQNDQFYSKKSQTEMNLGDKESALKTINDGLTVIPNSELLKTRLDVLQSSPEGNQDGIK